LPDRSPLIRLGGAVLAEQHDEWTEGWRYFGLDDVLSRSRLTLTPTGPASPADSDTKEVTGELPPTAALSASPATTGSGGDRFRHHDRGLDRVSTATVPMRRLRQGFVAADEAQQVASVDGLRLLLRHVLVAPAARRPVISQVG